MSTDRGPDGKLLPGHAGPGMATRWKKGESANRGGLRKAKREYVMMARESVPDAFRIAREIMLKEDNPNKDRLDAAKFLTAYGLGAPPKTVDEKEDDDRADEMGELTLSELRALARQSLEDDASKAELDADDDEADEKEH